MSARSIKSGVKDLLVANLPALPDGRQWQIYERYPRTLDNSKGDVLVLWVRHGDERRMAGSGRANGGKMLGVKSVLWDVRIDVISWGEDIEQDYDDFEDLVDAILQICRSNNTLGAYEAPEGTQVLSFAEALAVEDFEPHTVRQFIRYQSSIHATCEEIYNA